MRLLQSRLPDSDHASAERERLCGGKAEADNVIFVEMGRYGEHFPYIFFTSVYVHI